MVLSGLQNQDDFQFTAFPLHFGIVPHEFYNLNIYDKKGNKTTMAFAEVTAVGR